MVKNYVFAIFFFFFGIAVLSSSSDDLSVKTPRFNLNGSKLVWLERLAGGPHYSCLKLISYNWSTKEVSTSSYYSYSFEIASVLNSYAYSLVKNTYHTCHFVCEFFFTRFWHDYKYINMYKHNNYLFLYFWGLFI